jgi:hypothetical protein
MRFVYFWRSSAGLDCPSSGCYLLALAGMIDHRVRTQDLRDHPNTPSKQSRKSCSLPQPYSSMSTHESRLLTAIEVDNDN